VISVRRLSTSLAAAWLLIAAAAMCLAAAPAGAAALYPGEVLVADASAFAQTARGGCFTGCGGVIAVNPATGQESAVSDNEMAVNAQSQFMGAPFTLTLNADGEIIVGETAGLGGSCPSNLTCGGVVEVDPTTGKETVVSSNTMAINAASQYFGQVNGVAINQDGQIIVSDWGGCVGCGKVIEVDPATGKETLLSSNTMAINQNSQFLQYPQGLTIGPDGNIYVAEAIAFGSGGGIVKVDPATGKQTEVSSNEQAVNASSQYFTGIGGLVFDSAGDLLAADWGGGHNPGKIVEVDPSTGKQSIFSSNSMPANANSQYFSEPAGITIDQAGNIYVADEGAFCTVGCGGVIEVNPATRTETAVSSNLMAINASTPLFLQPWDVAIVPPPTAAPVSVAPPPAPPPAPASPPARGGRSGAPACAVAPSIAGRALVGHRLTAATGRWNPQATTYAYQWQRSAAGGSRWVTIAGAKASGYTLRAADVRARVRVVVSARNASGTATAVSAATRTIAAHTRRR
jgi:sugar lactone lactonase YvrE